MDVTLLCDASYCPDHKVAGYGFWIASARLKFGGGGKVNSEVDGSNTAEMMAICNSIYHGVKEGAIQAGDSLLIQSDSTNAIMRFEGKRVTKLTEQQLLVIEYYDKVVRTLNLNIIFRHVKGHTTLPGKRYMANRMCDKRARQHMLQARKDKTMARVAAEVKEILG